LLTLSRTLKGELSMKLQAGLCGLEANYSHLDARSDSLSNSSTVNQVGRIDVQAGFAIGPRDNEEKDGGGRVTASGKDGKGVAMFDRSGADGVGCGAAEALGEHGSA
jgi:hypothetical protein